MSSRVDGGASPPTYPPGRPKKNSIGSWFSKKFGRRPGAAASNSYSPQSAPFPTANDTVSAMKSATNAPGDRTNTATPSDVNGTVSGTEVKQPQFASAFASNQAHGLANTLTVPDSEAAANGRLTPPPQLDGIPSHQPLGAIDLPRSPRPDADRAANGKEPEALSPRTITNDRPFESVAGGDEHIQDAGPSAAPSLGAAVPVSDSTVTNYRPVQSDSVTETSTDDESIFNARDSIDNRTMDTSKSRASTKPTTLMSLDTREPTVLPTTHIAQPRRSGGEDSLGNSTRLSTGPRERSSTQIASYNVSRSGSGQAMTTGALGTEGASSFITVPSHSRPHPNNNPHPSAIPADNASVLTLASSTAGMSLAGASRHHHAPSLGGAMSIGGSLMGDRRNSSDTYASLKALPPLSRRGSDSSSRTRESVAASSTGQNSHQAMTAPAASAAPGAPTDRVSLHRTPSQKTIATQLSIPLSTSASYSGLQAYAKSEHTTNGSQAHLASVGGVAQVAAQVSEHGLERHQLNEGALSNETKPSESQADARGRAEVTEGQPDAGKPQPPMLAPAEGLLEAQASNLAATEHEKTLRDAERVAGQVQGPAAVTHQDSLAVPGGPPVA